MGWEWIKKSLQTFLPNSDSQSNKFDFKKHFHLEIFVKNNLKPVGVPPMTRSKLLYLQYLSFDPTILTDFAVMV